MYTIPVLRALAARITDSFCQKNMLVAIAHLTTTFANARRCFNANTILCDVFRPLIAKLVADEDALTVAEDTARKQALAHLSCVLANLAVLGEWDVNRSMLAGSLAMMVKHLGKQSDEFLEHISRGLANVSFYPQSADILLRCLKCVSVCVLETLADFFPTLLPVSIPFPISLSLFSLHYFLARTLPIPLLLLAPNHSSGLPQSRPMRLELRIYCSNLLGHADAQPSLALAAAPPALLV